MVRVEATMGLRPGGICGMALGVQVGDRRGDVLPAVRVSVRGHRDGR